MAGTRVVFYREADGTVPLLQWLDGLVPKVKVKCRLRIERLRELGHELRRPEADYLRDGIYELFLPWEHGSRRLPRHYQRAASPGERNSEGNGTQD